MSHELSRRQFLKLVSYASAGTAAVSSVSLISRFFADKANAQTTTFVRENIYTFMQTPAKVAALREGVRVMKARDSSDQTSWVYQANIHRDSCAHGTFFFLSWHRMYLYYFERILRQASGDHTLALPYWNYSENGQGVLPAPFRIPRDNTNPLFAVRLSRVNGSNANTEPASLPPNTTNYKDTFATTNFVSISTPTARSFGGFVPTQANPADTKVKGAIEKVPHDQIHGYIGGAMGRAETAAQDPIFWLHHANTDRLWELWLRRGEGRANPTNNNNWMNDPFTFFDENSNSVQMTGKDILDTAKQLNYIYDNYEEPLTMVNIPVASSSRSISNQRISASTLQEVRVAGGDRDITFILSDIPLTLTSPPQKLLERRVLVEDYTFTLNVIGVEYEPENPISYDIYINLPQGVAPDPFSPYYAGILSLFSLPQKGTFSLNITSVVGDLQRRNLIARDSISITFVPPPEEKPRNRKRQGRPNRLQQAVRFSGLTIAIE